MNTPFQLYSIGFASQNLQVLPARIRAIADQLGIKASGINGVTHFSESDVELIREALLSEMRSRETHGLNQRANIS